MIRFIPALAFALGLTLISATALAWEQTATCGNDSPCLPGQTPILTFWATPCIAFHLTDQVSPRLSADQNITLEQVQTITRVSLSEWHRPELSSLTPHLSGLTNETRMGFNPYTTRNANIIVFRDEWEESATIMALTTVTHQVNTGQIHDADIEINTQYYRFGIVTDDNPHVVDLQNTLTHELGHAFGLAHSDDPEATMFAYSDYGDIRMRSLAQDDLEAIATLYPPSDAVCQFKDSYFKAPPYAMNAPPPSDGCATSLLSARSPHYLGVAMFCFCLCMALRRRQLKPLHVTRKSSPPQTHQDPPP